MLSRISVGRSDDPGRGIADGRIEDLPVEDVSVETTHDLVDGGGIVPAASRRGKKLAGNVEEAAYE
jgi:hypothetical protein